MSTKNDKKVVSITDQAAINEAALNAAKEQRILEEQKMQAQADLIDSVNERIEMLGNALNKLLMDITSVKNAENDSVFQSIQKEIQDAAKELNLTKPSDEMVAVAEKKVRALQECSEDQSTWLRIGTDHLRQGIQALRRTMKNPEDF